MPKLKVKLPPLYHTFFPDFIERDFPEEKWATCSNCTLCRSSKSPYVDTKCCNYYPHLANYLVGGILQDGRPEMAEGKRRIRELIRKKEGITPYGIIPPKWYDALTKGYNASSEAGRLETREEYNAKMCPYLDGGRCTIWEYRENLCSTHFCVSAGGEHGYAFWKRTNKYLKMTENVLSNYGLYSIGMDASAVNTDPITKIKFEVESEEGGIDGEEYEKLWKHWYGKEEELYIQCYNIVASLDKQKFVELCGHNQEILAKGMTEILDVFTSSIVPEHLVLHPNVEMTSEDQKECTLVLADRSVKINPVYYMFLTRFDGTRTTKEILDQAFELMISLGAVVADLFSKGMLIPAPVMKEKV